MPAAGKLQFAPVPFVSSTLSKVVKEIGRGTLGLYAIHNIISVFIKSLKKGLNVPTPTFYPVIVSREQVY